MISSLWGVIYVRVSSDTQMQNGNWLQSQETACREFAKAKGIDVIEIFSDGWVSGKYLSREALDNMISYLKSENKSYTKIAYVITDDIDRISRDVVWWWSLKTTIESSGAKLLSLKQNLDSTPEWVLQQNIVMSFKQYERENNARRVRDRQRARMLDWYRPFYPPQGYKHFKWENNKKVLELVQPDASILAETLELFAAGMFPTKEDFRHYLKEQQFTTRYSKWVTRWFVDRLLEERMLLFYAWYIDYKPRDVNMVQAKHPAIIDKSLVLKILERLNPKILYKKYTYTEIDQKMPLRWVIYCEACGHVMTGWPSYNRHGTTYFYYSCRQKWCEAYGKSFPMNTVHWAFETLLKSLTVKPKAIDLLKAVCEDFSNNKEVDSGKQNVNIQKEIRDIEKTINQLEDRIMSTNDSKVIGLYERRLRENLDRKQSLESRLAGEQISVGYNLSDLFEDTKDLLESPCNIWTESDIEKKRLLVRVLFSDKISYWKISGLWTSEIPRIYRDLSLLWSSNSVDLEMARVELASKRHT